MSAHGSRTLHMMTVGLMKKYYGASVHIIETMIPLIMDAVELEVNPLHPCFIYGKRFQPIFLTIVVVCGLGTSCEITLG